MIDLRAWFDASRAERNKARTDLLFLCNEVLGYKDVSREVHGRLIDGLQHFPEIEERVLEDGRVETAYKNFWLFQGSRRKLFLFPRGHLKTTIITIAHKIQWILNAPNIRILLSTSVGEQAEGVLLEIESHFRYNLKFRTLFPEFCPLDRLAADWGNKTEFTVPNRTIQRKEPTMRLCTIGKVIAGPHYEVIDHSDLVDKENVKTPGSIADVKNHYKYTVPLLERSKYPPHHGWIDMEGTIYEFGDLHDDMSHDESWEKVIEPSPEAGPYDSIWPERFPESELRRMEQEMGPYIYSAQMRNKPIPPEGGLCSKDEVVFLSRKVLSDLQPQLRIHATIDLSGMEADKALNDYTAITVGGFDRDGRLYILDIRHGHFTPDKVIWHIFNVYERWRPVDFKIEKDAHARVLLPFFHREASKRQQFPTMVPIKRDTHTSKQQRIRGLQPWFKAGIIRFADDLACKSEMLNEILRFPSQSAGVHDDILDTLADMMQNQEGGVTDDVVADSHLDPLEQFGKQKPKDKFLGFDEQGNENWLYGQPMGKKSSMMGVL